MAKERVEISAGEAVRWGVIALLVLAGVGLYLWLGPRTEPIAPPAVREEAR